MKAQTASRTSTWIYSPALDLIIGCGGWSLLLLFLAYPIGGANLAGLAAAFYALALVFNSNGAPRLTCLPLLQAGEAKVVQSPAIIAAVGT